jgi:hypothetical protein
LVVDLLGPAPRYFQSISTASIGDALTFVSETVDPLAYHRKSPGRRS